MPNPLVTADLTLSVLLAGELNIPISSGLHPNRRHRFDIAGIDFRLGTQPVNRDPEPPSREPDVRDTDRGAANLPVTKDRGVKGRPVTRDRGAR